MIHTMSIPYHKTMDMYQILLVAYSQDVIQETENTIVVLCSVFSSHGDTGEI